MIYMIDRLIILKAFKRRYNREPSRKELFNINRYLHQYSEKIEKYLNDCLVELEIEKELAGVIK